MKLRLQLFFDSLRYSYITVPMSMAVFGLFLAWGTLNLDALSLNVPSDKDPSRAMMALQFGQSLLYSGGVDGARALLGAIAGSIISVAALASSIAITALALASGQFGSRLLRNFMDDRGFQITLGTFNGTFLFCLVILRSTRSADEGGGGVPQISVTMAMVLAVACVFLLIYFSASHGARDSGALCHRRCRQRFERRNRAVVWQERRKARRRARRTGARIRRIREARLGTKDSTSKRAEKATSKPSIMTNC